jgi:hypothetical protein
VSGSRTGESARGSAGGYIHDALLYDSTDELAAAAVPFLMDGLAAGDAAVIATSTRTAALLTEAIDADPRVHVLARSDAYRARTPAAILTSRRLAEQRSTDSSRRVRVVGEVDFGRTERDWLEWQRYEAVINHALAAWPLWGLCVYDNQRLSEQILESAIRTHPHLVTPHWRGTNPLFGDPAAICAPFRCRGSRWRTPRPDIWTRTSPITSACGTPSPRSLPLWTLRTI